MEDVERVSDELKREALNTYCRLAQPYANDAQVLRAQRDEAVGHLKGILRYAETVRNSAGAGKNQAARLDAARDFLNQLTAGGQKDDG